MTIALTAPVAIAEPGGVKLVENMVLAADAYPAVGPIPVVYKQPSGEAGVFHVGAIRVGTYTIADANGYVIESLPVEWSIYQSRLQALRAAADMIAVRVALSGN